MGNLLIIDSGHNEYVKGKESPDKSLREWKFNNSMQYKLANRLKSLNIDYYMTNPYPQGKDEIGLITRCNKANSYWKNQGKPNCLFLSIHANAYKEWSSARGVEVFTCKNCSSNSTKASRLICNSIYNGVKNNIDKGFINRGSKIEDFTVISKTNMPAVLVEYGFYTNKLDLEILKHKQDELVEYTLDGICSYFGVNYSSEEKYANGNYNKKAKTTENLNVRKGRGTNYDIVSTIPKGSSINVNYCLNNWFSTYDLGTLGYVSGDYIKFL
ncbi:hypothetical protein CHL78_007520 [Romboutsia weinsteinii]|uniref:SH3b domain-containing protein n=1 Tax=Romboutsia weinsteinii TaxID=2020949 RepID=A0A371J576_9FIRM|nr:N-acetylmuramoyl-L-alanine amidase [Romboutsia weinsteinii]RDY27844.1 hypothetical protein CHL78_007520 [Romboutsia weinsteinii]